MTKTTHAKKELKLTRVINAPRNLVFKAWTDPKQLCEWWGPKGFTNPVCRVDSRPGGSMYIEMKGPDGTVSPMNGNFKEVTEPDKIVFVSSPLDKNGQPLFEVLSTITFVDVEGKTKFSLHAEVSKITSEATPYLDGMDEGWNQTLDRLEELAVRTKNEPIVMERTLNAAVEKVWAALTDKDEMKKWYFDIPEFKPEQGLEFQFLAGEENNQYLHLCKVTAAIKNRKIAYTWRYDGYEGNSEVSFEFFPEGNKTRLKLTHVGLETFPLSNPDLAKENFVVGWTYILNTLEERSGKL